MLDVEAPGFGAYHEEDIRIGVGATIERTVVLKLAGIAESVVVQGAGSRIEARGSGFETRFGPEDLKAIPVRRFSMFDFIRAAPGVSPTSPGSVSTNSVSAFGSGTNENAFLIDGTNFTCPCSGEARSEPGVDFIQEVHVQSVGASAEFGNMQGAVINVITRQGSDRFLYDASYYGQTAGLDESAGAARVSRSRPADERVRARQVPRRDDEPRRSGRSRSAVVLYRIPAPARLRQSAGDRPGVPQNLRAGQDLREAHLANRSGHATASKLPRRVLGQSRAPDAGEAVRSDPAPACVGSGHDLRPPDAHVVIQHGVGCARRTVCVRSQRRPELGQRDDRQAGSIA